MAIIATAGSKAEVRAMGSAMDATVDLNGSLLEMLVSVYSYIFMAAIREAIQNGTDAARRAGLSFAEGVLVELPTASNPVLTVIDKGTGMTKEFMETKYLSLGASTKAGDNGAAGGLGIGRWAAYGYIRESYVTTCHASDMVERTYFMFQGPNGKPKVQLASEVPGTTVGTRVFFPVKESDFDEGLRAVAWLKEVMQLTMGDSFSVDSPALLPTVLPKFCGTAITLEEVDSGLAGVRIFPMQGTNLKYGRDGIKDGSLVVLANQDAGVGGLPFHVQSPGGDESVFRNGMVVEIPMSFNVPFMPSREELKYTDEVSALLKRIDVAAAKAIVAKVGELYSAPNLADKAALSNLVGNDSSEAWHWFARGIRSATNPASPLKAELCKVTGGDPWHGTMKVPMVPEMRTPDMKLKSTSTSDQTLKEAFANDGHLCVSVKDAIFGVTFPPNKPIALVVNDLKTGGTARFRAWLESFPRGEHRKFVFFSSTAPNEAKVAATALNDVFGGVLEVYHTSLMPAIARVVVGSAVVASRSRAASLTFFSASQNKQVSETMSLATHDEDEPVRIWLGKDGGRLAGFKETSTIADLTPTWGVGNLRSVLSAMKFDRLYLLTSKQAAELAKARAAVQADGLWDMDDNDFPEDDEGQEALRAVKALKSWKSFEDVLADLMTKRVIRDVLDGRKVHTVSDNYEFNQLLAAFAKRPRMELTGTSLDKAFAPYIDLLTGKISTHKPAEMKAEFTQFINGLSVLGQHLEEFPGEPAARTAMIADLRKLKDVGSVDYGKVLAGLRDKFPMLHSCKQLAGVPEAGIDHLCQALAAVYR